ncbi:TolC family protein [Pelagicoccus sp. NFK12]|uniref:TolC family protein n=1 Tax=Pelagicoccus enzymogenes TaxID=2773457 RepID=A0A927FF28_9BACT|nr:TolC family protein [Pelagicoccus enzymogenes]
MSSAQEALTPQDLISRALENNLGLEVSRLDAAIKEDNLRGEWGRFAPSIGVEIGTDRLFKQLNAQDLSSSSAFNPLDPEYNHENYYARGKLGGRLPFGSTYELSGGSGRLESTYTRRASAYYDPEYTSNVKLTVTQPLLRNFGLKVNLAPIRLAKAELEVARFETRSAIETVVARVLLATYETHFSIRNLEVKQESIDLAKALLEENKKRVEAGRMSPINVTQAEARVAEAEAELIEATAFFKQRQNQLQELTQENYVLNAADYVLADVEGALPNVPGRVDHDALASVMLEKNPDYLAAMKAAENEGIRVVYSKNQRYPEINLLMSVGTSGLNDDWRGSVSDFENREDVDWSVGLAFNMALDNRAAKSRHLASKKREQQALLKVKQSEVQLLGALDNAIYQLEAGIKRRDLIEQSVELAREALKAEERRLENGKATNYEVLNQQRELSVSRTQGLAAEVEVQKAWIQLLLLQGELSEVLGYDFSFAEKGEAE